jgi:hypothetical protein
MSYIYKWKVFFAFKRRAVNNSLNKFMVYMAIWFWFKNDMLKKSVKSVKSVVYIVYLRIVIKYSLYLLLLSMLFYVF